MSNITTPHNLRVIFATYITLARAKQIAFIEAFDRICAQHVQDQAVAVFTGKCRELLVEELKAV